MEGTGCGSILLCTCTCIKNILDMCMCVCVYIYIYINTMQSSDKVEKEALKGNVFSVNYENLFFGRYRSTTHDMSSYFK